MPDLPSPTSSRKTHGKKKGQFNKNSLCRRLTSEQRELLASWLIIDNLPYAEAFQRCTQQFGLSTSVAAVQYFYHSFALPWRHSRSAGAAKQIARQADGDFDAATLKILKETAFSLVSEQSPNLFAVKTIMKIAGDATRLSLEARKVALLEQRTPPAPAPEVPLTLAEKEARIKAVFGMT